MGKFVYVTNSSSGDVSGYAIDPRSGTLKEVEGSPFGAGRFPQAVAIDPRGKVVYVASVYSSNISAYAIHPDSGALTAVKGSPFEAKSSPLGIATCRVESGRCKRPPL